MRDNDSLQLAIVPEVKFELVACANGQQIGVATLDAPQSLHALTLNMIKLLDTTLDGWARDPQIACVLLQSSTDKAFCAGGDVRSLRQAILDHQGPGPNTPNQAFFSAEYRLDYRIHTYPKPLLVWGNGIVMGGGLGLFAGAAQRVVTQTTRIAMPEVSIGLFPDVGASYFLPRMPGRIGLFLGLTGAALNAQDALLVGLADHAILHSEREAVVTALTQAAWQGEKSQDVALMAQVLQRFHAAPEQLAASNLALHRQEIEQLCSSEELIELCAALSDYAGPATYLQRAAKAVAGASPTSLALVWELWQRRGMSLAQAFQLELIVALECCAQHDFAEGVRALLIDKDNAPQWQPARLADVDAEQLAAHFIAPWPSNPLHDVEKEKA